ncbi:MAG: polysaccharide biosynthesis protein [Oleiphilus sp.]|nr:MAG: polysaccharide biosynthesis protein [Oleiphilus sp.]
MKLYESIFKHMLFPLYERLFAKRKTLDYLAEYQANLNLSPEQLQALQLAKLKRLLIHARDHCAYYRETWQEIGFVPEQMRDTSELAQLPVVTKQTIQEHYQGFVAKGYSDSNIKKTTGGSTGVPFRFELDMESHERRQAVTWRGYGWLGAPLGRKSTYLWGADLAPKKGWAKLKDLLFHRFYHRVMLNSFAMTEANLSTYVHEMNVAKSPVIVSYVNPLVTLASYILEHNASVYRPEAILTGAEPLFDYQRETIEKAFAAPVYNTYGCREFMLMAAECKEREGLHINIDHLVLELLDEQGLPSDHGDVVVTDLHNFGFPLIRYVTGDVAASGGEACACGSPLPKLKAIEGRKLDAIRTADGKLIPGEFFPHLIKDFTFVRRFQVVQKTLSGVTIKLECFASPEEQELERLSGAIRQLAGEDFVIEYEVVDAIPLTVSGKHRVTVSELDRV